MSRRRALLVVVVVVVATVVFESDAAVRRIAVQRTDDVLNGCVELAGVELDLGSFPVAARALRGHLDGITVAADIVDLPSLRLRQLRGDVRRVRYQLLGGYDDITVEGADLSVDLEQHDLSGLLEKVGLPAIATVDDRGVHVQVDGVPAVIDLDIGAERGAAVIALRGPLEPLLRIRMDLAGVEVTQITPTSGVLRIRATVAGPPRTIACTAAETIDARLTALARLGELVPGGWKRRPSAPSFEARHRLQATTVAVNTLVWSPATIWAAPATRRVDGRLAGRGEDLAPAGPDRNPGRRRCLPWSDHRPRMCTTQVLPAPTRWQSPTVAPST